MSRLLLTTFLLALFVTCSGQKPVEAYPIIIKYFGNKNPFRDSIFLKEIKKIYGKGSLMAELLLKDTSYLKTLDSTLLAPSGEFVSSGYKIHLPIAYLDCTSDYEHVFSKQEIAGLDSLMNQFNKESPVSIAIVTIDSSWTSKAAFDKLVGSIRHNWGVEKDSLGNGVIIGLSKGLRLIRIDNGPGASERLTNMETKKIIDSFIIPEFKQNRYFEGTKKGLLAIMQKLR